MEIKSTLMDVVGSDNMTNEHQNQKYQKQSMETSFEE
jgi:hypothetical protein